MSQKVEVMISESYHDAVVASWRRIVYVLGMMLAGIIVVGHLTWRPLIDDQAELIAKLQADLKNERALTSFLKGEGNKLVACRAALGLMIDKVLTEQKVKACI